MPVAHANGAAAVCRLLLSAGGPSNRAQPAHTHTHAHTRLSPSRARRPTKQACKFRDEYSKFKDAGAAVFGISSDSPADNKAFADTQRLPFPLLTDPSSIMRKVRVCGVWRVFGTRVGDCQ